MSIYMSTFGLGYEHKPRCAKMRRLSKGVYEESFSETCTCGSSPIEYQGSHILPSGRDKRQGSFGLGAIPPHITRNGRDDAPDDGKLKPWLRVSLDGVKGRTCILDRKQVEELRDYLSRWLRES